jgi:hypothetical protein
MIYTHAAVGIAALAIGFAGAWKTQEWRHTAARVDAVERAAKDTFRNVERQDSAVGDYTKDRENAKVIYRKIFVEVDKIVERPGYAAQCIDSDGLRILYDALDGTDAQPGPVPAVPPSGQAR